MIRAVLSDRSFRSVAGGQWVSALGDGVFQVALAFTCLRLGGAQLLSFVFLAKSITAVLGLALGGVLTDRFTPRTMLAWSDAIRGAAALAIGIQISGHTAATWEFLCLGAAFGLGDGLFEPAYDAAIPKLVATDQLVAANTLVSTSKRLAMFLGPAIGAALLASIGSGLSFIANAVSFGIALAATVASGTWKHDDGQRAQPSGLLAEMRDGANYVLTQRWLLLYMLGSAVVVVFVFAGVFVLLPQLFRGHGGPAGYAAVVTAVSVGGFLGAVSAPKILAARSHDTIVYAGLVLTGIAYASVGLLAHTPAVFIFAPIAGAATSVGNIAYVTVIQHRVAPKMLGRVFAVDAIASYGLNPIAYATLAAIATITDPTVLFESMCALAAVLVVVIWAPAARLSKQPSEAVEA